MHITCYGAAREVTGSMHLLTTETDRILLDCGMFQGRRKESDRKNRVMPIDPRLITNIILSHAHIDHSGRIPMVSKGDFFGRVLCTRATAAASDYLLKDSAKIQESDANYLNYKTVRGHISRLKPTSDDNTLAPGEIKEIKKLLKKSRHELNSEVINDLVDKYHLENIQPLYTIEDATKAIGLFDGHPYRHPITIGKNMTCVFYDAGHILGSAITIIKARKRGKTYTICYTGDFGRFDKPILKNPTLDFPEDDRKVDLLIMESTYGNRLHEPVKDLKNRLKEVIIDTIKRNGSLLIPAFAFGRTQELIYVLHELYDNGEVPKLPVYIDSPLATNLTRVFGEHPELYDQDAQETFLKRGENPFMFKEITFVQSVEESMALMRDETQKIIIAASGMCEAGRILHHLRYKIHNSRNTILIVGFMAENTLGRRIMEFGQKYEESGKTGTPPVLKILNKEYPLKAKVAQIGGFSAHGDKNELLQLVKKSNLQIKKIALVHGEENQALSFADDLKQEGFHVTVPYYGESVQV